MCYVSVIGYTSVLGNFHIVVNEIEVHFIFVTMIIGKKITIELCG